MGDAIRDRTLVLRVLVPGLEARLSDKMKEVEEATARKVLPSSNAGQAEPKAILSDLEGVTCEPTKDHSTLWNFHCDGATYPSRLVNLPCPGMCTFQ
jgi:transcription initiation factor TFIID subunit 7